MKRRPPSIWRILLLLALAAGVAGLVFYVIVPSRQAWGYARELSDAMKGARSVTLVEFEKELARPELVFVRRAATPQEVEELRAATGAWYAPMPEGRHLCFSPHHRVEIVRADGTLLRFEVCFQCDNFVLGESSGLTMAPAWREGLARFFTVAGMPPREDYADLVEKH